MYCTNIFLKSWLVFFLKFLMENWLWITIRVISLWSDVFTYFLKEEEAISWVLYILVTITALLCNVYFYWLHVAFWQNFVLLLALRSRVFLLYGHLWIDQAFCCQDLFVEKNINYLTFVFVLLEIKWSLMQVFCFF